MILQPPAGAPDPWEIGNYQWSEAFLWIGVVMALVFGMFLFASYVFTRKKHILLWSFAFLGIFGFFYDLIGIGFYNGLVGAFTTSMFGMPTALLLLLIPGLLAAGLAFDKDEMFGKIYTWIIIVLTVVYLLMLAEPNTGLMADPTLSTKIGGYIMIAVQVISAILIIALSVLKESKMGPKTMMGLGGILLLTTYILYGILALINPSAGTVDTINMIYPFLFILTQICLVWGIMGNKDWGFVLPHVDFEE